MMNVEEKEENARTRTNELEIISALLSRFVPWRWKPALLWARHSHTALQQSALIYDQHWQHNEEEDGFSCTSSCRCRS